MYGKGLNSIQNRFARASAVLTAAGVVLRGLGCHTLQGFPFGRPVPPAELAVWCPSAGAVRQPEHEHGPEHEHQHEHQHEYQHEHQHEHEADHSEMAA